MNKDRAIENIEYLKECATRYREVITDNPQKDVKIIIGDKHLFLNDEMFESLDYVIKQLKESENE